MKNSLKILCIGNSFSDDMAEYAWHVARALGYQEVVLGNLFVAGCSLSMHLKNAKSNAPAYEFRLNTDGEWHSKKSTLRDGIVYTDWDYITMQQVSSLSGVADTYEANLFDLIDYVNATKTSPAKLYWHMNWAYQQGAENVRYIYYHNDQKIMYKAIVDCVREEVIPTGAFEGIIPCGAVIQRAREEFGDTLTRDGFHLSIPLGRYLAALTFMRTVTGKSVEKIAYCCDGIDAEKREKALACVEEICKKSDLFD